MKFKEINARDYSKKGGGNRNGCQYCGLIIHQICARCEILIHKEAKKYQNKHGYQNGIFCKDEPALCRDCAEELNLTNLKK